MESVFAELMALGGDFVAEFRFIFWYFIAGVALEALIRTFGWHIRLRKLLDRFGHGSIWLATGIGLFSPLCACGVLPLTISMILAGVPFAPAMTLLITSPLMSPAGYTLTAWELGDEWAIVKVVSAAVMGLLAGYTTLYFQRRGWFDLDKLFTRGIPEGDFHDPDYPCEDLQCDCRKMFSKRYVETRTDNRFFIFLGKFVDGTLKIGKFTVIGVAIEVLAARYIPTEWVTPLLTNALPLSIPLITLAVVPLHINQIMASAILYGFVDLPLAKGPGLAFLIGAPVTAIPVMAIFLTFFRRRVFFLYLGICLTGTIGLAYLYHYLF
ncbi:MAG: permease [bacterium]|nr:MAG: permease [bacterium]